MRICLLRTDLDISELGLDLCNLTNARLYNVTNAHKINAIGVKAHYAIVDFDDSIEGPCSDPFAVGLVLCDGGYSEHAVWDGHVWKILTQDALDIISAMRGIKAEDRDILPRSWYPFPLARLNEALKT
jgi:hypothetical protein